MARKKDELDNIPTTQRQQYEYLGFDTAHLPEDKEEDFSTPFLDQWKTDVFATVMGIVLFFLMYGATESAILTGSDFATVCYFSAIVFQFLSIVYAIVFFPTLLGHTPMKLGNTNVSFLNGVFGGPIFAPLWNHMLTRKKAGVSHIVFACMMALLVASDVISFFRILGIW